MVISCTSQTAEEGLHSWRPYRRKIGNSNQELRHTSRKHFWSKNVLMETKDKLQMPRKSHRSCHQHRDVNL